MRDGATAYELAQRCIATAPQHAAQNLDLRAAALAEQGDFTQAAATAWQAARQAEQDGRVELVAPITARARLYESGRPYRQ